MSTTKKTTPAKAAFVPELLQLDPSQIRAHPRNPRQQVTDLAGLVDSIRQVGILEPVVVAPWPSDLPTSSETRQDGYVLIAGHRRHAAAKKAGVKVPALHRPDLDTLPVQIEAMLVENLHRADLTAIEEGDAYQGLLDLGLTQADIATKVGRPRRTVSERVRVAGIPGPAREKLHAHQITIDAALAIAEFKGDADAQDRLVQHAGSGSWDSVLRELRARKTAQATRVKTRKALEKAGVKVLDGYPADPDIEGTDDVEPWAHVEDLEWNETNEADVMAHADKDAADLAWADYEAWHAAKCDGHAVVDVGQPSPNSWNGSVRASVVEFAQICTTPAVHEVPENGAAEPGAGTVVHHGSPSSSYRVAADPALAAGVLAGQESRRAFLRATLGEPHVCEPAARLVLLAQVDRVLDRHTGPAKAAAHHTMEREVLRGYFDLPGGTSEWTPFDTDSIRAWAQGASLPVLVVAAAAIDEASTEAGIRSVHSLRPYSQVGGFGVKWLRMLREQLGYDWTDFEAEHVPDWLGGNPRSQSPGEATAATEGDVVAGGEVT